MANPDELAALFKQAADIAAQVPEPLREIAFQRALDALQVGVDMRPSDNAREFAHPAAGQRTGASGRAEKTSHSADVTTLLETLDRTEMATLLRGRKVLDRSLLLLRAAQRHGIECLTPSDIATVLTKKFREATAPNAVRMALDRSPAYTDRRPSAGSYVYTIMSPGEEYLDSLETPSASMPKTVVRPIPKIRKRAAVTGSEAEMPAGTARAAKTARRRNPPAGRPGPKAALEAILEEGFFSSPRTVTDILTHLREQKTFNYKTSDMTATLQRLVRQNRLSRSRNAEAQFEYAAK